MPKILPSEEMVIVSGVVPTVLCVSVAITLLQGLYIWRLLDNLEASASRGDLVIGSKVPPLLVKDLSGVSTTITYDSVGKPTLLYVFRPSCVWCRRNANALLGLAKHVSGRYRLIRISLGKKGLLDFTKAHEMNFPIYSGLSSSIISSYHLW